MFKGGGAAAGGDKGAEAKKEVEELVLEPITIDFLKQVWPFVYILELWNKLYSVRESILLNKIYDKLTTGT